MIKKREPAQIATRNIIIIAIRAREIFFISNNNKKSVSNHKYLEYDEKSIKQNYDYFSLILKYVQGEERIKE